MSIRRGLLLGVIITGLAASVAAQQSSTVTQADIQRLQDNENTATTTLGQVNFSNLQSFLQGTISNFNVVPNRTGLGWRSLLGAWYVQDTIRLRPNLTLEVGIRHEFTTGWNEVAGRAANYITDAQGVLLTNTRVGKSALTENNATHLFGTRIGIAWDPFGD